MNHLNDDKVDKEQLENLKINVNIHDADLNVLEKTTLRLKEELKDPNLDIEQIELDKTSDREIPQGARGDLLTIGILILKIAESSGALKLLINKLQTWLDRHNDNNNQKDTNSSTTLTLEINGDKLILTGENHESHKQLIDLWISRHAKT